VARALAKGSMFQLANPEAATRIAHELYPVLKYGRDDATALREDTLSLAARAQTMRLEPAKVTRWGEASAANYQALIDCNKRFGTVKADDTMADVATNDLLADIVNFDPNEIVATAKAYK